MNVIVVKATDNVKKIAGELRRMYEGPAWHGPSFREAVDGVSAAQANARPIAGAHSIFELTHHVGAWIGEVESRLRGNPSGNPAEGDWPREDSVDDAGWRAVLDRVASRHSSLLEFLKTLDPSHLDAIVDPNASPPSNLVTGYVLLHGLVQHNAYHIGQISILRKGITA